MTRYCTIPRSALLCLVSLVASLGGIEFFHLVCRLSPLYLLRSHVCRSPASYLTSHATPDLSPLSLLFTTLLSPPNQPIPVRPAHHLNPQPRCFHYKRTTHELHNRSSIRSYIVPAYVCSALHCPALLNLTRFNSRIISYAAV